jgi:hypothetical protein
MTKRIQKLRRSGSADVLYGELEVTTCNFRMFVNGETGDDAGAVGDADHPFATVERAMQRVPARVAHRVWIYVTGGDYAAKAWPRKIDNIFEPGGLLGIVCTDAPADVQKDVEISSADRLNGAAWLIGCSAENWDDHELAGYWISGLDDNGDPYLRAIADNSSDVIRLRPSGSDPAFIVGGTFDIVQPAAMFTMDEAPVLKVRSHGGETCGLEEESYSPLAIIGIGLDCSGVSEVQQWAIEGNGASIFAQCFQLIGTVDGYGSHFRDCSLNVHLPDAPTILAGLEKTLYPGISKTGQGPGICLVDGDGAAGLYYAFYGECAGMKGLVVAGILELLGCDMRTGLQ